MAMEAENQDTPPTVRVAGENEPRCGKLVYREGDRDVLCDLPADHPETIPCSAPLGPPPASGN
jgi:hypothetical protein